MAKKTKAVGKAAKSPTVKQLRAEISSDTREETSLKHEAATARRPAVRKHELAEAASLGKKVKSLKHQLHDKTKKKRGLALAPGDVSCCAAQALAMHAWLATGVRVHDEDVLALYWRTAGDPDEGASILSTLEAAREYGLSGAAGPTFNLLDALTCSNGNASTHHRRSDGGPGDLLLGLTLPEGPHTVTVAPDGAWWSWGEPYSPADFPGAVIDECWAVHWS